MPRRLLVGLSVLLAALVAPASALAAPPEVETEGVRATGATTETVFGFISPSSLATKYQVLYDVSTSEWCETSGSLGAPSKETTAQSLGFTDEEFHEVAVHLSGLTGGTTYCAAVRAKNGSGSEAGFPLAFTAGEPTAETSETRPTGATTATVTGFVAPAGQTTTVKALYDVSTSPWCESGGESGSPANSTSAQTLGYTDATLHAVAVHLTGLTAGKTYCAAIEAVNASDAATGGTTRFTEGVPLAADFALRSTGASTATLEGDVDAAGEATTYKVLYDLATSEWCTSAGTKGSPANSTSAQPLSSTDSSAQLVAVHISALSAGKRYCAALQASNGAGTATASQLTLTAGAPLVSARGATATGGTTATVYAELNPAGQSTNYKVGYDTATSEWCTSGGAKGSPSKSTSEQTLPFTDAGQHLVAVQISSLTTGTAYCAQVQASNASANAAGAQSAFKPGSLFASNGGAHATGATTASVSALVGPGGETTTYKVLYDLATSEWCSTAGAKGSPANSTSPQTLAYSDLSAHQVVVHLTGLTSDKRYCEAPQATNASGTATGSLSSFVSGAPTARTFFAEVTSSTTATISGSVNPAAQATKYQVVYDLATSEWCGTFGGKGSPSKATAEIALASADTNEHSINVGLTGLTSGKRYCAAVRASNASAVVTGTEVSFDTTPSSPGAEVEEVLATGSTTELLLASVDPFGQTTTYKAIYDLSSSEWCESEAQTGKPAAETSAVTLAFTDREEHIVAVNLSGLSPGHEYCAILQATNASGTTSSFPVTFIAGAPSAQASEARSTGATTATIFGQVDPVSQATTYKVLYDLASSEWCESGGSSSAPAHSTSPQGLGFTDNQTHAVAVHVSGLTPGARYCAELQAVNAAGASSGFPVSFKFGEPTAASGVAQNTSATSATLSGSVGPAGQTTTYKAVYDVASSEWCESSGASSAPASATSAETLAFSDQSLHAVSLSVSGLAAGTRYCAAVQATNATGTATGTPTAFTAGAPTVSTREGVAVGATAATVVGFVNPAGQTTTYWARYGPANSEWCESSGVSGAPANETSAATLGFTDAAAHEVSVALSGLTGGKQYCAEIQAASGSVTAASSFFARFSVGQPAVFTIAIKATSATSVAVDGIVNPAGQATTYKVLYDLASSEWCESDGTSSTPANETTPATLAFSDTSFHEVTVSVPGLSAGARYCFAVQTSNASATTTSTPLTGVSGAPSTTGTVAQPTGATGASVESELDPAGQSTTYKVLYDLSTSEWCESQGASGVAANATTTVALGFTDTSFHHIGVALSGLVAGKTYCAAVEASNASAASEAPQATFTVGQPSAATLEGLPTGASTASIAGFVDPAGETTTYKALYGPAGSEWCESEGQTGSPAGSTTAATLGSTGTNEVGVSVALSGLTAGTRYCAAIQASNATATVTGLPPVPFTAGAPTAATLKASATGPTTAKVDGSVNPAGQTTTYKVLYDTSGSEWCESGGASSAPSKSTTAQALGFSDSSPHEVSVSLSGLTTGTSYCAALQATSGSQTSTGSPLLFLAAGPPAAPEVATQAATGVTEAGATLHATVNPNGSEVTECKFEYGTTTGYGASAPCATLPGSGSSAVEVTAAITGLLPSTTYHFRISAKNAGGTGKGSDETLKTLAPPAPEATTTAATGVTQTTATLTAKVNPKGTNVTECKFEYGTTTGYGASAPCATLPGSGSSAVEVTAAIGGLTASTTYHFRISATNAGGTSKGADETLGTLAPAAPEVITTPATSVTQTTAMLTAKVNPEGSEVTGCKFEYGTTTGYGSSVPCATPPGSGSSTVAVSATLSELSPNATYHFRISATNGVATREGADATLKTLPPAPVVATASATSVTATGATLTSEVNPEGSNVTECKFEYGTTTGYGASIPCASMPGSGATAVAVSAAVAGLTPGTTYHFRISATNAGGTSAGADGVLTTLTEPSGGSSSGGSGAGSGGGSGGGGAGGGGGGAGAGSPPTAAQIAAQLVPSGKGAKLATLLKHAGVTLSFKTTEAGTIAIEWFVTPVAKHGKKAKPVLVATGHATASGGATITVTMRLTAAGKRLLKAARQIKVTARATFTPANGSPVKAARTFLLRR